MTTKVKENTPVVTYREEMLAEANSIVVGTRSVQYGGPEENFRRIATIWGVIMGITFSEEDVAMMMAGLKLARHASRSGFQPDTWVDIAGYAACGYEVGKKQSEKNQKI